MLSSRPMARVFREQWMQCLVFFITYTMARTRSERNRNSENIHFYLFIYIFNLLSLHTSFNLSIFLNVLGRLAMAIHHANPSLPVI